MRVGLDIGSTTIKCVVLGEHDELLYSTYERHYSHILEKAQELLRRIEHASAQSNTTHTLEPLFANEAEYQEFSARHAKACPPPMDAEHYTGDAYLGIDAGSTTTKLALIAPDGGLLYTYYASNEGNPVAVVKAQLEEIYRRFGDRITIKGSAATGYGEDLVKNAFHVDMGLVETMAH